MSTMFLVCGLSGSGKTYWASKFAKNLGYLYVNPDKIYELINGDECIHEDPYTVWTILYDILHHAEERHMNVVVDTDAPSQSHRAQFLEWFPNFDKHYLIFIDANKELRYKNNASRKRKMSPEALKRQEDKFEIPIALFENWDAGFMLINVDNKKLILERGDINLTGKTLLQILEDSPEDFNKMFPPREEDNDVNPW